VPRTRKDCLVPFSEFRLRRPCPQSQFNAPEADRDKQAAHPPNSSSTGKFQPTVTAWALQPKQLSDARDILEFTLRSAAQVQMTRT